MPVLFAKPLETITADDVRGLIETKKLLPIPPGHLHCVLHAALWAPWVTCDWPSPFGQRHAKNPDKHADAKDDAEA